MEAENQSEILELLHPRIIGKTEISRLPSNCPPKKTPIVTNRADMGLQVTDVDVLMFSGSFTQDILNLTQRGLSNKYNLKLSSFGVNDRAIIAGVTLQ